MEHDVDFEQKIIALLVEAVPRRFRKPQITASMRLQSDLGIDSLALASLVFRLEGAFDIDLSAVDLNMNVGQLRTVDDAIRLSRSIVERARAAGRP